MAKANLSCSSRPTKKILRKKSIKTRQCVDEKIRTGQRCSGTQRPCVALAVGAELISWLVIAGLNERGPLFRAGELPREEREGAWPSENVSVLKCFLILQDEEQNIWHDVVRGVCYLVVATFFEPLAMFTTIELIAQAVEFRGLRENE